MFDFLIAYLRVQGSFYFNQKVAWIKDAVNAKHTPFIRSKKTKTLGWASKQYNSDFLKALCGQADRP